MPSAKTNKKHSKFKDPYRIIGAVITLAIACVFAYKPSWPTPDKIFVFLTFLFMALGQAKNFMKRFGPFVALLLVYESFRGIAGHLNHHVHYTAMANFDKWLFGGRLPTAWLQSFLWDGNAKWYDMIFYLFYMLHFILPLGLAILIWKKHVNYYWQYVTTFVVLSFAGFTTFALYPAAPPWIASNKGIIEPITRISSAVFSRLGINDFPSIYNKISPNPVAAVPSLHTAYAVTLTIFIYKLFGRKWAAAFSIYPAVIIFSTVYMGEHYIFDALAGASYAVIAYLSAPYVLQQGVKIFGRLKLHQRSIANSEK